MKYNLLQNKYDKLCDSFINGIIESDLFQKLESIFIRDSFLFTIYLN